jgi:hypothetical protein|tara:strand:- start:512 stop:709 length:198 start_codon:yes stop_codon:yes gene_type:complete
MGIIDKIRSQNETPEVENTEESKLTQSEIEFVLVTLRECDFKGKQVVSLYNTVLKLQQQYKENEK